MDLMNFFNGVSEGVQNGVQALFDYLDAIYLSVVDTYEKINLLLDLGMVYIIVSAIILLALLVITCQTKTAVKELQKQIEELKEQDTNPADQAEQNAGDLPE